MMKEFRLIHVSAATPRERGVQYGRQAKEEIRACIDTYRDRFQSTRGMSWDTVRGYAAHESETYENVPGARAGLAPAMNAAGADSASAVPASETDFQRYNSAQDGLNRALSIYVNAVREAYPDLKADTQFVSLQDQLEGTENRIATERGRYTEIVRDYNVRVRKFPANIWAGLFGYHAKPQFAADEAAATAPTVQF